jgi:telomere length regulation protein
MTHHFWSTLHPIIAMNAFVLTPRPPGNDDGKAEPLLTAVSSSGSTHLRSLPPASATTARSSGTPASLASASDVLDSLRNNPSQDTVVQSLHLLDTKFDFRKPSAVSSQITKVLLETTLPDFWHVLSKKERVLLAKCLASLTGLGGITARLKVLAPLARDREAQVCRENLGNILVLLQMVLGRKGFIYETWTLVEMEPEIKRHILWRELTALVAGGRLLSVAAEAESVLGRLSNGQQERWVGDGKMFALWLGREIAEASLRVDLMEDTGWKAQSLLLTASFRLGYSGTINLVTSHKLKVKC